MNNLTEINSYITFKAALGCELNNQAKGFVRTGYLLKRARDTDILSESGYTTVAEFAKAEYGLSKDVVSRYMAINDKYSIDGYSEQLQEKYEGYGIAKLQEMLTLPEEIENLLSPEMTKSEIREVKKELKEEEKISDVEVYLEKQNQPHEEQEMSIIQKIIFQYFKENKEQFIKLNFEKLSNMTAVDYLLDIIAPSGVAVITVRIPGTGRMMMSVKGADEDIEILNVRSNEHLNIKWQQLIDEIICLYDNIFDKEHWESLYNERFDIENIDAVEPALNSEIKAEVAPAQQKEESEDKNESQSDKTKQEEQIEDVKKIMESEELSESEAVEDKLVEEGLEEINEEPEKIPPEKVEVIENERKEIEFSLEELEAEFLKAELISFLNIHPDSHMIIEFREMLIEHIKNHIN